ncbi:MAG TPA: hypothetical protein VLF17_02010 [Candidatus Nitrosotenuis sp.]|nr:hypothetical protein [Candidatus Nitrosotenuis sp.]
MKSKTVSAVKGGSLRSHDDIFQKIQKYNPTLRNILKVEQLFVKHKEFDSKVQLTKKLDVAMRPPVLNVILKYLERSNKILIDDDGSLVWIYASPKAKSSWEKAVRL